VLALSAIAGRRAAAQCSPPKGEIRLVVAANADVKGAIKLTFKANKDSAPSGLQRRAPPLAHIL
jgi:hypothetical protein